MKEELMKMLEELENYGDVDFEDYSIDDEEDKEIHIEFNDFEGFEDNGEEIDRDFENEELVNKIIEFLEKNAKEIERDLYTWYDFGDFEVQVGYASFNI